MGLFFSKKKKQDEEKVLDKVLELVKVVSTKLTQVEKEVDMIKEKLRSPLIKKKLSEGEEELEEKPLIDDGFDELRALRKTI